jgi:hypothetical protein
METSYKAEVAQAMEARITRLKQLTFEQAASLPESAAEEAVLGGSKCTFTVFRQQNRDGLPNTVLVTVQVARRRLLIMGEPPERGVVFTPEGAAREATVLELCNSGG